MLRHVVLEGVPVARIPRDTDSVNAHAALIRDLVSRLRVLVITAPEGVPSEALLVIHVDARTAWVAHGADRA